MEPQSRRKLAVARFAERVRVCFGSRLKELTLFGSEARGEAHGDSDIDIAVVIDDLGSADAREIDDLTGDLLTELDVLVTPFLLSSARAAELRRRERLIMTEIARDGVAL